MKKYLALDIGGTFVKYGIVKENTEIEDKGKEKTPKTLEGLLDLIAELASRFRDIDGIAVSAPGAVSDNGIIYGFSALAYLHGPNIKELIMEQTGCPVYMENDANCAGYAEVWAGAAKGKKDVLVIAIGTGIGGAVIKDGVLHKGAHLHGGEFGFMLMSPDIATHTNTWSGAASTIAMVRKVAEAKCISMDSLSGEEIFKMAEEGDRDCIKAIEEFYHLLAYGIYNLQYIYDPEVILIGGGISAREDLILRINEKLDKILEALSISQVKPIIDTCQFRQDANLLGAVYGFIQEKKQLDPLGK